MKVISVPSRLDHGIRKNRNELPAPSLVLDLDGKTETSCQLVLSFWILIGRIKRAGGE
jgi:hypothetical protein